MDEFSENLPNDITDDSIFDNASDIDYAITTEEPTTDTTEQDIDEQASDTSDSSTETEETEPEEFVAAEPLDLDYFDIEIESLSKPSTETTETTDIKEDIAKEAAPVTVPVEEEKQEKSDAIASVTSAIQPISVDQDAVKNVSDKLTSEAITSPMMADKGADVKYTTTSGSDPVKAANEEFAKAAEAYTQALANQKAEQEAYDTAVKVEQEAGTVLQMATTTVGIAASDLLPTTPGQSHSLEIGNLHYEVTMNEGGTFTVTMTPPDGDPISRTYDNAEAFSKGGGTAADAPAVQQALAEQNNAKADRLGAGGALEEAKRDVEVAKAAYNDKAEAVKAAEAKAEEERKRVEAEAKTEDFYESSMPSEEAEITSPVYTEVEGPVEENDTTEDTEAVPVTSEAEESSFLDVFQTNAAEMTATGRAFEQWYNSKDSDLANSEVRAEAEDLVAAVGQAWDDVKSAKGAVATVKALGQLAETAKRHIEDLVSRAKETQPYLYTNIAKAIIQDTINGLLLGLGLPAGALNIVGSWFLNKFSGLLKSSGNGITANDLKTIADEAGISYDSSIDDDALNSSNIDFDTFEADKNAGVNKYNQGLKASDINVKYLYKMSPVIRKVKWSK